MIIDVLPTVPLPSTTILYYKFSASSLSYSSASLMGADKFYCRSCNWSGFKTLLLLIIAPNMPVLCKAVSRVFLGKSSFFSYIEALITIGDSGSGSTKSGSVSLNRGESLILIS